MNKKIIFYLLAVVISIITVYFFNNNYFMYKDTVVKVISVENNKTSESTSPTGITETYYKQNIIGVIKTKKNKNSKIELTNETTTSNVVTEKYNIGDELIVNKTQIIGLKRDKYVALISIVFILSIMLVGKLKGFLSVLSVVVNTTIFILGLNLYLNGFNLIVLCICESILFTILSLFISNGFHKKTISAIISVIISTFILFGLTFFIIKTTNFSGINFNGMNFLTVPAETVFMAELIMGGLGAIMDVCITISASFAELIEKDINITSKSLINSGRQIGGDIMGTMINVIFFTYLCGGLPIFALAIRNGFSLSNYITSNFTLELTRFLVGSIGIVLAIPISLAVSYKVFKGCHNE